MVEKSESVSTGTPQVPGSTPREKGDIGLDTPVSGSAEKTPAVVVVEEEDVDMEIDDDDDEVVGVGVGNGIVREKEGVFVSAVGFGTQV